MLSYRVSTEHRWVPLQQLTGAFLRCRDCASAFTEKEEDLGRTPKCPECSKPFSAKDLRESRKNTTGRLQLDQSELSKVDFQTSTKLKALIKKLNEIQLQDPMFKALIFSQVRIIDPAGLSKQ
jgi:DNA repair protein RAD5